jgi:hypothetical protein
MRDGVTGAQSQGDVEPSLDVEMAFALAPGATITTFEAKLIDSALNTAATHMPVAYQVSSSFGLRPLTTNSLQELAALANQGQSLFVSSGDGGAVLFPQLDDARAADFVTLVGGTSLTTTSTQSYSSETAWTGSSGGFIKSLLVSGTSSPTGTPYYQQNLVAPPGTSTCSATNGASAIYRNFPDISMDATNVVVVSQSQPSNPSNITSGTSGASPLWASFMALMNEASFAQGGLPYGYVNPLFYQVSRDVPFYQSIFNDINDCSTNPGNPGMGGTAGLVFKAVPGYDLVTGLGTPKCSLLQQPLAPRSSVVYRRVHISGVITAQEDNNNAPPLVLDHDCLPIGVNPAQGLFTPTDRTFDEGFTCAEGGLVAGLPYLNCHVVSFARPGTPAGSVVVTLKQTLIEYDGCSDLENPIPQVSLFDRDVTIPPGETRYFDDDELAADGDGAAGWHLKFDNGTL